MSFAPPWIVEGVEVDLRKDVGAKTLSVVVPEGAFNELEDDEILHVLEFVATVAERFRKVVPEGWTVLT